MNATAATVGDFECAPLPFYVNNIPMLRSVLRTCRFKFATESTRPSHDLHVIAFAALLLVEAMAIISFIHSSTGKPIKLLEPEADGDKKRTHGKKNVRSEKAPNHFGGLEDTDFRVDNEKRINRKCIPLPMNLLEPGEGDKNNAAVGQIFHFLRAHVAHALAVVAGPCLRLVADSGRFICTVANSLFSDPSTRACLPSQTQAQDPTWTW